MIVFELQGFFFLKKNGSTQFPLESNMEQPRETMMNQTHGTPCFTQQPIRCSSEDLQVENGGQPCPLQFYRTSVQRLTSSKNGNSIQSSWLTAINESIHHNFPLIPFYHQLNQGLSLHLVAVNSMIQLLSTSIVPFVCPITNSRTRAHNIPYHLYVLFFPLCPLCTSVYRQ